jgi:hypothetical protein
VKLSIWKKFKYQSKGFRWSATHQISDAFAFESSWHDNALKLARCFLYQIFGFFTRHRDQQQVNNVHDNNQEKRKIWKQKTFIPVQSGSSNSNPTFRETPVTIDDPKSQPVKVAQGVDVQIYLVDRIESSEGLVLWVRQPNQRSVEISAEFQPLEEKLVVFFVLQLEFVHFDESFDMLQLIAKNFKVFVPQVDVEDDVEKLQSAVNRRESECNCVVKRLTLVAFQDHFLNHQEDLKQKQEVFELEGSAVAFRNSLVIDIELIHESLQVCLLNFELLQSNFIEPRNENPRSIRQKSRVELYQIAKVANDFNGVQDVVLKYEHNDELSSAENSMQINPRKTKDIKRLKSKSFEQQSKAFESFRVHRELFEVEWRFPLELDGILDSNNEIASKNAFRLIKFPRHFHNGTEFSLFLNFTVIFSFLDCLNLIRKILRIHEEIASRC